MKKIENDANFKINMIHHSESHELSHLEFDRNIKEKNIIEKYNNDVNRYIARFKDLESTSKIKSILNNEINKNLDMTTKENYMKKIHIQYSYTVHYDRILTSCSEIIEDYADQKEVKQLLSNVILFKHELIHNLESSEQVDALASVLASELTSILSNQHPLGGILSTGDCSKYKLDLSLPNQNAESFTGW